MRNLSSMMSLTAISIVSIVLSACASSDSGMYASSTSSYPSAPPDYSSRLPSSIENKSKVVLIDPNVHAWGAYQDGVLVKAGQATAGSSWCPDIGRPCRTSVGRFTVKSLGAVTCKSSKYPLPRGGAPMPYCMFFNGNQGMHGSNEVVEGNISHGCVRMHTADAEWLRFNFVRVGTPVIVKPY